MNHAGYSWTIRAEGQAWFWAILPPGGGAPIISGEAPSRPAAAALIVRAIARGMTAPTLESIAA